MVHTKKDRRERFASLSISRLHVAITGITAALIAAATCGLVAASPSIASTAKSATTQLSAKECAADKAAGTINYVSPFGYTGSPGVIDIFEAENLGYFKDLCLTVKINAAAFDNSALVSDDSAQATSTADGPNLFTYDSNGGNKLVGVETVATANPESLIMQSKYKSLKAVEGGTVGYEGNLDTTTLAMLAAAKVPISSVKFIDLSNRNPATDIQQVTATGSFIGNQDLTLKAQHVGYTEITAGSLGLGGTTNVMVMNKSFVKAHPVAAENFIRASIKALDYCVANSKQREDCISYLSALGTKAGEGTLFGLKVNGPVWAYQANTVKKDGTKPLGTFKDSLFEAGYRSFKKYATEVNHISGIQKSVTTPSLSSMLDPNLVASLYTAKGQLIWP